MGVYIQPDGTSAEVLNGLGVIPNQVARGMVNMGIAQQRIQSSVAQARAAQQRQQEQQRREAEARRGRPDVRAELAGLGLTDYVDVTAGCHCGEDYDPEIIDNECRCEHNAARAQQNEARRARERQAQEQQRQRQQQQQNAAAAVARATPAQPATAVRSGVRPVVTQRTFLRPILPARPR